MKTKRIQYEDDIVIVYNASGKEVYRGLEDYDPNKDLDWEWDEATGRYEYKGWHKVCLATD